MKCHKEVRNEKLSFFSLDLVKEKKLSSRAIMGQAREKRNPFAWPNVYDVKKLLNFFLNRGAGQVSLKFRIFWMEQFWKWNTDLI